MEEELKNIEITRIILSYLKITLPLLGISTIATISRTILSPDRRTLSAFLRGLFLAIFVGMMVAMGTSEIALSDSTRGAIVGVCAFVTDDILLGVIKLGELIRKDPIALFRKIFLRKN